LKLESKNIFTKSKRHCNMGAFGQPHALAFFATASRGTGRWVRSRSEIWVSG